MGSIAQLTKLYSRIQSCDICHGMNHEKALRRHEAVDFGMDTFIISQALAEKQLRRSGVNFFTTDGKLGSTGKFLEKFLNRFDRTVFPPEEIRLESGLVVPKAKTDLLSVYNTEIAQCFPGKGRKEDRPPTSKECATCVNQGFLEQEISIIKPKLLLLMGDKSRRGFYEHVQNHRREDKLGVHLNEIVVSGEVPSVTIGDVRVFVLPIQHASGANPSFQKMLKNECLVSLIKRLLIEN